MWRVGGGQTQLQREDVWQVKPASGKYLFISYLCARFCAGTRGWACPILKMLEDGWEKSANEVQV